MKQSGKKRKIPAILFMIALPVFLTIIVALSFSFFYFGRPPDITHPPYEEGFSQKTALQETIRKTDFIIYDVLYRKETSEEDVFFIDVQPRHENGHVWEFADLVVKCKDRQYAYTLSKSLIQYLSKLAPVVKIRCEHGSKEKIVCHIFAEDKHTHRVTLSYKDKGQAVKDRRPKIAIIIDDLGYDPEAAASFIALKLPFTFSVLPCAPFTEKNVREVGRAGCEIMLHLPMEPKNYPVVSPGPGAVYLSMSDAEIRKTIDQDLKCVTTARGVNNHMGSSFTENRQKMGIVLDELKKRDLFFVDSRTTVNTVALKMAKEMGVAATRRHVFLDNDMAPKPISLQLERLFSMARHKGTAVGIAHPHMETIHVLEKNREKLTNRYHLVPVSELVN